MAKSLTENDIDQQVLPKVYTQTYGNKPVIEGVSIVTLKNFIGEDGDLSEVIKFTKEGTIEGFDGFKIEQINRTKLYPRAIKGWHLHLRQDDLWHVLPSSHIVVGLWDIRSSSKTKGAVMRVVLGGGESKLLFIPKGVAHGAMNVSQKDAEVLYFVNQRFDASNPDEKRLPWNSLGADFWKPLKD